MTNETTTVYAIDCGCGCGADCIYTEEEIIAFARAANGLDELADCIREIARDLRAHCTMCDTCE